MQVLIIRKFGLKMSICTCRMLWRFDLLNEDQSQINETSQQARHWVKARHMMY